MTKKFRDAAKECVGDPNVPAVAEDDDKYANWTKIALLLLKEEINKLSRELEDYPNGMPTILDVLGLETKTLCDGLQNTLS